MDDTKLEANLAAMQRIGAATMHLVSGRPPSVRVQRRVVELDAPAVTAEQIDEFVRDLLFSDHRKVLAARGQVEVLYMGRDGLRYRVSVAECAGARSLTMRSLPTVVPTLQGLELPDQVGALTRYRSGLVLVAGFFGSGKSTTLAALANVVAQDPTRNIVSIEDSIEFVHESTHALVHQQEIGTHVDSAVEAIQQAVAAGADTILLSEFEGHDVLEAVLAACEAGCLVFCGVESGSVVGAISELSLTAPSEERARLRTRMARVLRGVTAQYLVPRAHKSGRIAVVEVLVGSPAVRAAIRKGALQDLIGIMHRYRGIGMQTTRAALYALHAAHLINPEDAQLHAAGREGPEEPVPSGR